MGLPTLTLSPRVVDVLSPLAISESDFADGVGALSGVLSSPAGQVCEQVWMAPRDGTPDAGRRRRPQGARRAQRLRG